ncbi:MAG TPA: hypothetical protein VGM41_21350 [Chitinophagaceae bacterium]|jgi:hypothetical protein
MYKFSILVVFLLLSLAALSQDSTWKIAHIDENLTLILPARLVKRDTTRSIRSVSTAFRTYRGETATSTFVLTVTPNTINGKINNRESLGEAYDVAEQKVKGLKYYKGLREVASDTVIDKAMGRKMTMYNDTDRAAPPIEMYFFLVNDKIYYLLSHTHGSVTEHEQEMKKILRSIHFTVTGIKEQQFDSKLESKGYKIGYIIGRLLGGIAMIFVIVLIIILISRKSSKNQA